MCILPAFCSSKKLAGQAAAKGMGDLVRNMARTLAGFCL
jgi:hypothetical protein